MMKLIKEENSITLEDNAHGTIPVNLFVVVFAAVILLIGGLKFTLVTILALLFLALGLYSIVQARFTKIKIDKGLGKLYYSRKGIIGSSSEEYLLTRVKSVKLEKMFIHRRHHFSRLKLILGFVLDDKTDLSFDLGTVPIDVMEPLQGGQKAYDDAKMIADFIGVKLLIFEPEPDPSLEAQKKAIEKMQEMSKSGKFGFEAGIEKTK